MNLTDSRPPSRGEEDNENEPNLPPAIDTNLPPQMIIGPETPSLWNPEDVTSPIQFNQITEEEIENMDQRTMRGMLMAMSRQVHKPNEYKRPLKCDDFLGLLRWFSTTIGVAPKLNIKNWHVWNPLFLDAIDTWSDALRHLQGKVKPVCEIEGPNNLNYILARPKDSTPWTFHELYEQIKTNLLKNDDLDQATILRDAGRLRMYNNDVRKLIEDIRNHWAKADTMGHPLPQLMKIQTLINSARYNASYATYINTLECMGNTHDFDRVAAALLKCQEQMQLKPIHQVAAPGTASSSIRVVESSQTEDYPESYWNGKAGPNGEAPKCYNCFDTGHIAKKCPKPRRPCTYPNDQTNSTPA
ncbi:uncharacterized protein UHO2_05169 [Ustilago hordei]|uniref:uncharacterized protein n=1 Tax=Ustilago hordei TaxID=120017 RepID=UPI001A4D046F|nr:uncharacterized protein UHO2_05169 [Ustilago hordei]SYW79989.1 uncharacterized protein UHO2_05169 [Ustilago hordei]